MVKKPANKNDATANLGFKARLWASGLEAEDVLAHWPNSLSDLI